MQDPSIYSQIKPQFPEQEHLKCPRCDSPNTKFCYYNNYNLSQPRHYCKSCKRYWTKGGTLRNIPVGGASRKNTKRSSSNKKISSTTSSSVSSSPVNPKPEPAFVGPAIPASRVIDMTTGPSVGPTTGPFSSLLASNGSQFGNLLEALNPNDNGSNAGSGLGSGSDARPQNGNNISLDVQNGGDSNCWKFSTCPNSNSGIDLGSGSGLGLGSDARPHNRSNISLDVQKGGDSHCWKFSKNPISNSGLGLGSGSGSSPQIGNNTYMGVQNGGESNWLNGSNANWPDLAIYTPGSSFH